MRLPRSLAGRVALLAVVAVSASSGAVADGGRLVDLVDTRIGTGGDGCGAAREYTCKQQTTECCAGWVMRDILLCWLGDARYSSSMEVSHIISVVHSSSCLRLY